jgi:hypothetical protein
LLDDLNRTLLVTDEQSDLVIGAVVDEVWNAFPDPPPGLISSNRFTGRPITWP